MGALVTMWQEDVLNVSATSARIRIVWSLHAHCDNGILRCEHGVRTAVSASGRVYIIREVRFVRKHAYPVATRCKKLSPVDITRRRIPTMASFLLSQRAAQLAERDEYPDLRSVSPLPDSPSRFDD